MFAEIKFVFGEEIAFVLKSLTYEPSIYAIDHPGSTESNFMEKFIGLRIKHKMNKQSRERFFYLNNFHWRSSHYAVTQLRTCVIKIVTFKGGHLMC